MLSCQQTQNVIDGKKRIILNPSEAQRREFESATFAEGEVYGIDILISSGEDGKVHWLRPILFAKSDETLGPRGRIANDDLPEGFGSNISAQDEEFSCGVH